jgi:Tol biopolymer transport system component
VSEKLVNSGMKPYYLAILVLLNAYRASSQKHYDVCYSEGLTILLLSTPDKKEDTLDVIADNAMLSPDGTRVAYTKMEENHLRQVEIMDLKTGATTLVDAACHQCYGPVWSPDGKQLVYNGFSGSNWNILLWPAGGGAAPVNITKRLNGTGTGRMYGQGDPFSPTWSADGKKILIQDMRNILVLDLAGRVLDSLPISSVRKDADISSASRYLLSRDETKIIFDMQVNDSSEDDPPRAIYVYDRKKTNTIKVSPDGFQAFQPVLKGDRIFFNGYKVGADQSGPNLGMNIYSVAMDGAGFRLEYEDRRDFSYKK